MRRAAEAGFPVRSFLMAPRWLDGLADVLDGSDAPCYVLSEALAEQVTGFHVHRGALASLARLPLPSVAEVLREARTVVVLEDLVDHTNVGAAFRCAAALGVDAVLIAPRCADPLYRRAVKVGMGAVFALPWTRLPDWYDALPDLSSAGFTTVALTLADDATALEEAVAGLDRVALVLGSGGARVVRALGTLGRPSCGHLDAGRRGLAQRGRRRGRRLLRHRETLMRGLRGFHSVPDPTIAHILSGGWGFAA